MRIHPVPILLVALGVLPGSVALAQELPATAPGGVATVVVTADAPAGVSAGQASYALAVAPAFRLYAPGTGTVPLAGRRFALPVTLGVPITAEAGTRDAGTITVTWPDGTTTEHRITVHVAAIRRIEMGLSPADAIVSPGERAELSFWVRNRGNAVDTARIETFISTGWELDGIPDTLILVPGDTARRTIAVRAPDESLRGQEQSFTLNVHGVGNTVRATSVLMVASEAGWLGGYMHLPSTVFVGSSLDQEIPGIAVRSEGPIAPGTDVSLEYRHSETFQTPPAFREDLFGPRFRATLRRSDLQVAAGEVFTAGNLLSGPILSGRGLDANYSNSAWRFGLFAALPGAFGASLDGHQIRASATRATGRGPIRLTLTDIREQSVFRTDFRSQGAALRYQIPDQEHHELAVEAGLVRVVPDSGETATGATLDAEYGYASTSGHLTLRARLVPGTVPQNSSLANELFATGAVNVTSAVSVTGWSQYRATPILNSDYDPEVRAASMGVRSRWGRAQTELSVTYRQTSSGDLSTIRRRTAAFSLDLPIRALSLEADAELGTYDRGAMAAPFTRVWGGAYWYTGPAWLRAGLSYSDSEYAKGLTILDLAGAWRRPGLALEGGIVSRLNGHTFSEGVNLWGSAKIAVLPDVDVTFGTDLQPGFDASHWRLSLGLTHRLGLPVPVRRQPALRGTVYEDRNGNRVQDVDEPVLPGVRIHVGRLETTSAEDGTFQLQDTFRGPLRVDPATLPAGMVIPLDVYLPISGIVDVPVVETASLELDLFLDRNGDEIRDPGEDPAGQAVVSIIDARGNHRDVLADNDGHVLFGAVSPGSYEIRVYQKVGSGRSGATTQFEITLEPGAHLSRTVAVPAHVRQIRMGAGGDLNLRQRQR